MSSARKYTNGSVAGELQCPIIISAPWNPPREVELYLNASWELIWIRGNALNLNSPPTPSIFPFFITIYDFKTTPLFIFQWNW